MTLVGGLCYPAGMRGARGGSAGLAVRIAGIGKDGEAAAARLARQVRSAWGCGEVRAAALGEDRAALRRAIRRWCDRERADVVLAVGRSEHLAADFAPEAVAALLDRPLPGVEELVHAAGSGARAPLFRGRAGIRGETLVLNVPAEPRWARAVLAFLAPVLPHALAKMRGESAECAAARESR